MRKSTDKNALKDNDTKQRILLCAKKLILKYGYAKVSMRNIAEASHVSLGQITYHFAGKDSIFLHIVEEAVDELVEELSELLKGAKSENERISLILVNAKSRILKNPDTRRLFMDFSNMAMWSPSYKIHFAKFYRRILKAVSAKPAVAARKGGDKTAAATSLSFGISMMYLIFKDKKILDTLDMAAAFFKGKDGDVL